MIIIHLQGGLGNQMFQYALGRSLSIKNRTLLKFDISHLGENDTNFAKRNYNLSVFNIKDSFATQQEIANLEKFKKKPGRMSYVRNILFANSSKYFQEKGLAFDPAVLNLSNDVYLDGYWQSEKYFKNAESQIRDDFSFVLPQGDKDEEVSKLIDACTSISIHIRRADYVTDTNANKTHGTCSVEYYIKAVELLAKKASNPHFFVFSDDHEWVKENIKIDYPTVYVDHNNTDTSYQDLRLMSLCKHNIIANSSFSWWGAWLNNNPDKIVITPQKWFTDITKNDSDLTPSSWIRI